MKRMACVIALATGTGLLFGPTVLPTFAAPLPAPASGLQIAVAASNGAADSASTLDVTFKGGNINAIELYLDGSLVKKQAMHTREGRGVISFALDGLSEGAHDVLIKAFDADGNCATATAKWKVSAVDADVLARFVGLKPNAQIQGVFPIQIKIDDSVRSPYVTFLIDNDFLAFMNYAPFTYNWDTEKVANGLHTIGVEVFDGETLAKVKTLTMQINVNNPGGFTKINHETTATKPAPANPAPGTAASDLTKIVRGVAENALPNAQIEPMHVANALSHSGLAFATTPNLRAGHAPKSGAFGGITKNVLPVNPKATTSVRTGEMTAPNLSETQSPFALDTTTGHISRNTITSRLLPPGLRAATPGNLFPNALLNTPNTYLLPDVLDMNPVATHMVPKTPGTRNAAPNGSGITKNVNPAHINTTRAAHLFTPGTLGQLANPMEIAALASLTTTEGDITRLTLRARRAGNVAARPGFALKPGAGALQAAQNVVRTVVPLTVNKAATKKVTLRKRKPGFFATFDAMPVDFDVPTREVNGIALTPFRQIFEHTGGEIGWYEKTQTVRAVNKTTEIQIKIGSKNARVNNKNVKMESKAFVDKGRTMVPISFLKDAMNVKVHYDEKTGHLLIESNK